MGKKFENDTWKLLDVDKLPKKGKSSLNLKEFVGLTLKYLYKPRGDVYEIKVLDYYMKNSQSCFDVECYFLGERIIKEGIQCSNLLQQAWVGRIIPSTNKWIKENGYWVGVDSNGKEFKFSCRDKEIERKILYNTWCFGCGNYVMNGNFGRMHRLIKESKNEKEYVDHINSDKADNREENLRITDAKGNSKNMKTNRKDGQYVGMRKSKSDKFFSRFMVGGHYISTKYKSEEEAEIDNLIAQEYLGFKHNEKDFKRIKDLPKERIFEVINLLDEKLEKQRNNIKESKFNNYKFEDCENYIKIFIKDGEFMIDRDDIYKLDACLEDGNIFLKGNFGFDKKYIVYMSNVNGKRIQSRIHRYILGLEEEEIDFQVDHLDQNPLNNRKDNLEIVTRMSNLYNKSGKGYGFNKNVNKYQVSYARNYKYFEKFIGGLKTPYFVTEEEAKKEVARRKEIMDKLRVRLHSKEELEEFKQYVKDNDFENYDEAYLYWKGYLK